MTPLRRFYALRHGRVHRFHTYALRKAYLERHADADKTPTGPLERRLMEAERGAHFMKREAWVQLEPGHELLDESCAGVKRNKWMKTKPEHA